MRRTVKNKGGFLPSVHFLAHDLCFAVHDILTQFLVSGEESGIFKGRIAFDDKGEAASFEATDDIFDWLENSGRFADRAMILKALVLPAVLSDMLHCLYEALESSRKAKLNVTYILVRKPLQESLYLLESIVLDELDFAAHLATDPLRLRPKVAGGPAGHVERIQRVLETIGQTEAFDATYLAQLRYEKVEDGFDGICNKAIHLFTEHKAIKTELLNINFVFSGIDAKVSQWQYFYSRMPYLLVYIWRVVEHIGASICATHPDYDADVSRRVAAFVVLSEKTTAHKTPQLKRFYDAQRAWLLDHCAAAGCRVPRKRDIERMALCGALPGEDQESVDARFARFEAHAAHNRAMEQAENDDS